MYVHNVKKVSWPNYIWEPEKTSSYFQSLFFSGIIAFSPSPPRYCCVGPNCHGFPLSKDLYRADYKRSGTRTGLDRMRWPAETGQQQLTLRSEQCDVTQCFSDARKIARGGGGGRKMQLNNPVLYHYKVYKKSAWLSPIRGMLRPPPRGDSPGFSSSGRKGSS